jgi:hypothetical protein
MKKLKGDRRANVGLCADCLNARIVESDRGTVFWRCELSVRDPRFPRYPRLPVRECSGYVKNNEDSG